MTRLPAILVLLAGAGLTLDAGPQTFRTSTHAVSLDVAVHDGDRVVASLGVDDFEVLDNGVPQVLSSADYNLLPIDLRLVFDTSGSISDDDLSYYLRAMRDVTATLEPRDRCEIITFNSRIADAAARQAPPVRIALQRGGPDGTAFFDAVSLALVTVPDVERRQVTIVLSDGRDNASLFDEATVLNLARRTDAVVHTVLPGDLSRAQTALTGRLHAIAMLTGGRLTDAPHPRMVGRALIDALEEFRQSYVLRYTLRGVAVEGWHELTVRVRGARYRVRARTGYLGG